jgi:SAM-dependent methyltransferase
MQPEQAILKQWSASAPYWEKHREIISKMFAPVTQALVGDAQIGEGQTVLDIATGPGEPALSLVGLVGPRGRIFGIDPVPGRVAAARRAADKMGAGNAQFEVGYPEALPFPDGSFDAVVSRFGVMFFASPVDGVREMLRVLKPGGRLAMAAWHVAEANPFFTVVTRLMDRYFAPPLSQPDAADAFRFASPGKLRNVLTGAGASAPAERVLRFAIEASVPVESFWTLRCEMSEKLREKSALLSTEQFDDVKCQAMEALREYATDRGMSFPAEVLIVSGTKPR